MTRSWTDVALAVVLVLCATLGFGYANWLNFNLRQFPPATAARIVIGPEKPAYSVDFNGRARAALLLEPLNQKSLNAVFVHDARTGAGAARLQKIQEALASLGWRYTPAQQNLMYRYALAGQFPQVMDRIQALLLRQSLRDQALEALYTLESDPRTRSFVIDALAKDPRWRGEYLRYVRGFALEQRIGPRIATLTTLLDRGAKFDRADLAPFLARLDDADAFDAAYAITIRSIHPELKPGTLFDPAFVHAARYDTDDRLPFEWNFVSGNGNNVVLIGSGDLVEVRIRWNGTGLPIFARQRFLAEPGRYQVTLTGLDAKPEMLSKARIVVECPGRLIAFVRPVGTSPRGLVLEADQPISCRYPEFQIRANDEWVGGSAEIALSDVQLRRVGGL